MIKLSFVVANKKERYISLCIPLKMCGKNENSRKNGKILSAAHSLIFPFFLDFFSHFFKGMNKEKYHYLWEIFQ